MSLSIDQAIRTAAQAASEAADILAEGFMSPDKQPASKGHPNDRATVYDRMAEKAIVETIMTMHPNDGILSEESVQSAGTSGRRWIVDPLDGTNNFISGIPHFAVSIALAIEDQSVLGCVCDPIRGEIFTAIRSKGAYLNGLPIGVSHRQTLEGAVLGIGLSYDPARRIRMIARLQPLLASAGVLRTLGSAALDLAYVAAGRLDAVWYLALSPWDVAAAMLLVEEAGGAVTGLQGTALRDPEQGVAASNGHIHDRFLHALL